MSDDQKPISPGGETEDGRNNKGGNVDSNDLWGDRPKYISVGKSKFAVNESVHYQVGTAIYGPYLIARVPRRQVYVLCDADGNYINNEAEFSESSLIRSC